MDTKKRTIRLERQDTEERILKLGKILEYSETIEREEIVEMSEKEALDKGLMILEYIPLHKVEEGEEAPEQMVKVNIIVSEKNSKTLEEFVGEVFGELCDDFVEKKFIAYEKKKFREGIKDQEKELEDRVKQETKKTKTMVTIS